MEDAPTSEGHLRLTQEESRALAFIAGMILLSILGRWADRPQPLSTDLARINIDSLEAASLAATPRKGRGSGSARGGKSGSSAVGKAAKTAPASGAPTPGAAKPRATAPRRPPEPVDINRASAADLERIPGIGKVLAGRIIAYRDSVGRFANVDALLGVKGVGPAMLERLRPYTRAP